ncbi:hypothetical protein EHQ52_01445 [Leptospira koniambonensis]|uniref:Uncharacterized protein n=1 Tax=Leptospira koniambonensis TaxID=2484950 RepID=A0A4R9JB50_9LEPT|nr:hypothetical protein [Leptospira koniambonensis]TGL36570.1 hypothetical protein EHQ52_01445 [Leptospira koniambonensis]
MRTRFVIILALCFSFSIFAENENGEWKEYGLKEVLGRLKFYAFAKIAQSVRTGASFDQEIYVKETACNQDFPKLEGNFHCSLLKTSTFEDKLAENSEPTTPNAASSTNGLTPSKTIPPVPVKAKWYEGRTLAGKGVLSLPGKEGQSDLKLFYHTDGKLSHYSYEDKIVVFDWKGHELSTILIVKVDSLLRPLGGKEYYFP